MIPKTIKVGSQVFRIVSRDPASYGMLHEAVGYSLDDENLIVLSNRLSETKKKQTLLHEILSNSGNRYGSPGRPTSVGSDPDPDDTNPAP